MTDPAITAALNKLIADTPPPVTVWGVRYTESFLALPAGRIAWCDTETEAREWLAEEQAAGYPAELVSITGHVRVHPADVTATDGADR